MCGFLSWQNKTKNSNRPKTEDFSKHLIAWILFGLVTESTGLSWIEGTISVYSQELSKIFLIHNIDHFVKKSIPLRQPSLQGVEVYSHFVMCIQRRDFVVQYLLCCVGENMDFHCIWIIPCYLIKVEKGYNCCSPGQLVNTEDLLLDEDIFFSCPFFVWIIISNVGSIRIWDADFSSQKSELKCDVGCL